MLIVLEGLDGAGKSTQIKYLQKYYTERGKEVKYLHFPRFDSPVFGGMIAKFLRGDFGDIDSVHPMTVALLYAGDRGDAAPLMNEWLKNNQYVVILDRYIYSNIAFQCAKISDDSEREDLRNWIFDTEYNYFKIPVPDLNLFLDVPISFVHKKLSEQREGEEREYLNGLKDIHEANISFQNKVREVYLHECERDEHFIRIDCSDTDGNMASATEIFEKIKNYINIHF